MRILQLCLVALAVALATSCATKRFPEPVDRPDSQVFVLGREGGFQNETLELADGRFRYWFSSDIARAPGRAYPLEGTYSLTDTNLVLSSGQTYSIHRLTGTKTLWKPEAVERWNRQGIIPNYGILLPVESIKSPKPSLRPLFTEEEWSRSSENVRAAEKGR